MDFVLLNFMIVCDCKLLKIAEINSFEGENHKKRREKSKFLSPFI